MGNPVAAALKRHGLGGVFFLHGADAFRREEAVRALIDAHVDEGLRDFNLDPLRGADVDVDTLASILATPPMMAEWRVVVIRDADSLAGSPRARNLLLETAGAPPPGLAFIVSADTTGSSAKLWKELRKNARAVSFVPVGLDDVPGWLIERARTEFEMELTEPAARALGQAVGTNLGVLTQELAKLREFVEGSRPVTREDVAAVGTVLPAQDRWAWFDMVTERRFEEAAAALPVLLGQAGESGVGLTLGLGTHLLRLGVVVDLGPKALEDHLHPRQSWLARKYTGVARKWTSEGVQRALSGLLRVDRLLKSSPLPEDLVLEEWLLSLEAHAAEAA